MQDQVLLSIDENLLWAGLDIFVELPKDNLGVAAKDWAARENI
jgi:hypothetical protein